MCAKSQCDLEINGRTHHLLVSAWGEKWRRVRLAFFTAYIDDSGTSPIQPVANATVLIIPGARLPSLENDWNRLKNKEGFSCWHTTDVFGRNLQSEFASWDITKKNRVFRSVRAICKRYCVHSASFSVYKPDYDKIVLPQLKFADKHHYTWANRNLLSHLEEWRVASNVSDPLEYVFSWMGEKRKNLRRREIEDLMDQAEQEAKSQGSAGEFENYSFRKPCSIPALQCVDALAWTVYQGGLLAFEKRKLLPEARLSWDDFKNHLDDRCGLHIAVKREKLQAWVKEEVADGRSLHGFTQWQEAKQAKTRRR
jgi:Protein of unknown function (DUF3800)